jgi:tetratricopeptide (TPR) repeat protein
MILKIFLLAAFLLTNLLPVYSQPVDEETQRGIELGKKGDFKAAIEQLTQVVQKNPKNAEAYYNLGLAHNYLESYDQGIVNLSKAIELKPYMAEAYGERAIAYMGGSHNYQKALEDFSSGIKIKPEVPEFYTGRGKLYMSLNDGEHALADFNKAIELDPKRATVYFTRAVILCIQGIQDKGKADYQKTKALGYPLDPKTVELYSAQCGWN